MSETTQPYLSPWRIFLVFLRLGLTSFGGPAAHIGYFRDEFVSRRRWLDEQSYAELVALCQFLPGPSSSQIGLALGLSRAGYAGALAAWLGFTLPSALALILFSLSLLHYGDVLPGGFLQGLKVVAVAVVAQAVWGMARSLCPDVPRISLMIAVCCLVLWMPGSGGQLLAILCAALVGWLCLKPQQASSCGPLPGMLKPCIALLWLGLFFALLIGLPLLAASFPSQSIQMLDAFYRAGALVFGGGHVVLPLLQSEVVHTGWVSEDTFLAGYSMAQAVPGPLFTFAAFLGSSMQSAPSGWIGGLLALVAIFIPSFLLVLGVLPFWQQLRHNRHARAALSGVNAGVVGLLLATLYRPVWSSAIHSTADFSLAVLALVALMFWRLPAWLVVIACALAGGLMGVFLA